MKKTIIIILAILPIVLVVAIAFAGRILSIYRHVPVEKVVFLDSVGDEIDEDYVFTVDVGQTKKCEVRVFPDLASNKTVSYTSSDESICTVDSYGNITGVSNGSTTVMVKTFDSAKIALLKVKVTADRVTGVSLSCSALELTVGSSHDLGATVVPNAALDKSVTFTSDNTSVVTVSSNGKITALSPGTANVIVTTSDGGFTATCVVTVTSDTPPISFDFTGADGIVPSGEGYIVSVDSVDLKQYILLGDGINFANVRFEIVSGSGISTLTDGVLTFTGKGVVIVAVYTGDAASPENRIEIRMLID